MPVDPATQIGLRRVIRDDMARLSAAADLKLFNAITASAQASANGDKLPACGSPDANDFVGFGLDLAKKAQAALMSLPAGYPPGVSTQLS